MAQPASDNQNDRALSRGYARPGMAKKKPSVRRERRALARDAEKLVRDRERLARLEPGGETNPVVVDSASQIEPHALALSCLRCAAPYRLEEHAAVTRGSERLRVTRVACPRCGSRREVWFCIAPALPN
jgi:hypothetical protein